MNAPDFCVFRFLPIPKTPKPTQEPFLLSPTEKALMGATNREIWRLYQEALHNHSNYEKTTETADLNPTTCTAEALVQAENNPLVATFWGGRCVIPVSEAHRRLHTYITGSAGSGKSEAMKAFIWHYLTKKTDTALVLIAPESDICQQVARFTPNLHNDRLVYINPLIDEIHFPCLNPFDFKDKAQISIFEAERRAMDFLAVFTELLEENDADLSAQMTTILQNVLPVLMKWENANIYDLLDFLDKEKCQKYIDFANLHFQDNYNLLNFINSFLKNEKNNPLDRTLSALHSRIYNLFSSSVLQAFLVGQSTIDLEALIAQKKLIIFDLPKGKLGRNTDIIGKMLVAQIKILAFKKNPAFSCHLFIDEMHNFITSSMLEILEECRKFRLHLTMAQQQFGQGVSESRIRNSIIGNTGIKLTGLNGDDSTLKALASSTGSDVDELKKHLHRGVFSLWQAGLNAPPEPPKFISIPRTTLGNKQGMSDEQWKAVKNLQISRFYRRLSQNAYLPSQTPPKRENEPLEDEIAVKPSERYLNHN